MIPINGSELSTRAIDHAIAVARNQENVILVALYVLYFREESYINFMAEMSGTHANFEIPESKNNKIEKYFYTVKEMANQNHVELITDIVTSVKSFSKVIVEYAEANSFDLIVIGKIGRSSFRKYLLGGVTSSVVTRAHCPVMVIK